ncbi:uncharacterized protein LOC8080215 isoform X3 [Sorghum bicolor]|uniref:Ubiquitin-like protease family profile domain-containing protein n=1 Tax=Sorghum bicolor TaxID=4558 RepID=A0A1B6QH25_SORBI|nr:uncharacterized protein LOC8080215 isoform X3 [Sorghum bicolor]KXG37225.2 hypothetical protein SORBI_3001G028900 [Sorghum bicolor]|eukprot:XP_021312048.1 uncharacterized protein LOC8080215 isoform X3 [Sorghum bicolor]
MSFYERLAYNLLQQSPVVLANIVGRRTARSHQLGTLIAPLSIDVKCTLIVQKKMDHNVGSSNDENSDVRHLKKAKMSEEKLSDEKTMASPTRETLSSDSKLIDKQVREEKLPLDDEQQPKEQNDVVDTYDYLPQDYTLTNMDLCAQILIETSSKDDLLVKIDEISVKQHQLLCLLDQGKWLDDDVISAYICCIRDQVHLQNMDNAKIYFQNPFITGLFKRDGNIGVHEDSTFITEIVRKYLEHEMIFLPINIKDNHWYLAVLNARKSEIQVLDSLCWKFNRADLTIMLQGLQYHLDILESQQNLIKHVWKDLHVTKWKVREKLQEPIQKDSSSCGLFLLKFMEYWTGDTLSHPITQESINLFRYKLAGILSCWKSNTAPLLTNFQENLDNKSNPDDVIILESANVEKNSKAMCPLSIENKYYSLMSILSKMGIRELVGGLCDYIKSINCPQTLEKVWVQNCKPYSISLTLKKLQEILNHDMPMDIDTFNLVVPKHMLDDIQMVKNQRGMISKHYLDLQFWAKFQPKFWSIKTFVWRRAARTRSVSRRRPPTTASELARRRTGGSSPPTPARS